VLEALGWVATGLFASSYFCKSPSVMRRVQASAAALWIAYGIAIRSAPVIASNVLVAVIAAYSSLERRRA
jgi:Bacterial inner membrane protein